MEDRIEALIDGARNTLAVAMACACAGIVIGCVSITGLGIVFTQVVIALAQNSLLLALVLTAMAGIVLGMGMPTTPAYIVMVSLLVPAMIKLGAIAPAAHMFAFYFAILSAITPPVALAVFAAASLAKANMWQVGLESMRVAAPAYIVPFMFVYEPSLLLIGDTFTSVTSAVSATVGVVCLAAGLHGLPAARVPLVGAGRAARGVAAADQAGLRDRRHRPRLAGGGSRRAEDGTCLGASGDAVADSSPASLSARAGALQRWIGLGQRALRRRRAPDAPTLLDADLPCGCGARRGGGLLPVPGAPRRGGRVGSRPWITLGPRRGARFAPVLPFARATAGALRAAVLPAGATSFAPDFDARLRSRRSGRRAIGSGSGGGAGRQIVRILPICWTGAASRSPQIRCSNAARASRSSPVTRISMSSWASRLTSISCNTAGVNP